MCNTCYLPESKLILSVYGEKILSYPTTTYPILLFQFRDIKAVGKDLKLSSTAATDEISFALTLVSTEIKGCSVMVHITWIFPVQRYFYFYEQPLRRRQSN